MTGLKDVAGAPSFTFSLPPIESRSASIRVNIGGMCCVMMTGTGKFASSPPMNVASATGPPVEHPTANNRTADGPVGFKVSEADGGRTIGRGLGGTAATAGVCIPQMPLILPTSSVEIRRIASPTLPTFDGLVT